MEFISTSEINNTDLSAGIDAAERQGMTDYWVCHSQQPTIEGMLLDNKASSIDQVDRPEILSYVPDYSNKRVLELASGIGRFTGAFAETAKQVVTVEFMKSFLDKNQEANSKYDNIDYICGDVLTLDFPPNSFDISFSCWLLMYLADGEVAYLAKKLLEWTTTNGYLFFRESCFRQSGDVHRSFNPSKYRHPSFYSSLFSSVSTTNQNGRICRFELVGMKNLEGYTVLKGNKAQLYWLFKKVECEGSDVRSFREFLDNQQYTKNGILRYEKIFGNGFVSTGGMETTVEFVDRLGLERGMKVLDVGCGIGGGDFYMANQFGVFVHGIDLSTNMLHIAFERATQQEASTLTVFEFADATKKDFANESFDVIYSRDTILHISDKLALFKRFYNWLKPNGKLLISDYCCGKHDNLSNEFNAYVQQRGYILYTPTEYGELISEAGFSDVIAEDRTDQFVQVLKNELIKTKEISEEFINEFSEEDYNHIIEGWEAKVNRCADGDQKWGLFVGTKL